MAHAGWYNTNARRSYPLIFSDGNDAVPDYLLVDAGFVIGHRHAFLPGQHQVLLSEVVRISDDELELTFTSDAPKLAGHRITMTFWLPTTDDYATGFVYAGQPADLDNDGVVGPGDLATIQANLGVSPATFFEGDLDHDGEVTQQDVVRHAQQIERDSADVQGFVVLGDVDRIKALLPTPGSAIVGSQPLEFAVVRSEYKLRVDSVSVANSDRTRATSPNGCRDLCLPFEPKDFYPGSVGKTGDIVFVEGYNCLISQNDTSNAITIGAAVGLGEGEPCEEVPVFSGEALPSYSQFYDGSPACNEVLRTINGEEGPSLRFKGERGVVVSEDPDNHTIFVDVRLTTSPVPPPNPVELLPGCQPIADYGDDPCGCGPE